MRLRIKSLRIQTHKVLVIKDVMNEGLVGAKKESTIRRVDPNRDILAPMIIIHLAAPGIIYQKIYMN